MKKTSSLPRKRPWKHPWKGPWSIGHKILAATVLIVTVVLCFSSAAYFFYFSRTTEKLIDRQSREITKQIVFNYDRYISSVIETANFLHLTVTNRDVDRELPQIQEIFSLNSQIKRDLASIFLFDDQGRPLAGDVPTLEPQAVRQTPWFHRARTYPDIFHFSLGQSLNAATPRAEEVITVVQQVQYLNQGSLAEGLLVLELNTNVIKDLARKTNLGEFGHLLILDNQGSLVYTSSWGIHSEGSYRYSRNRYLGVHRKRIRGIDFYINVNSLYQTRWRIVTVLNVDVVTQTQNHLVVAIVLIFLGSLGITAMIAGFLSFRISKPIHELKRIMARIERGDLSTPIAIEGQREIVELSRSFRRMVDRIRSLMDKLVEEQKEKRKTALRALQNQINPHFLYNTLDSIIGLAEEGRNQDVVKTVAALAKFFRLSISRGATFIPVQDEVEQINSYLTIQQIRYARKFSYTISMGEKMKEHLIMKLLLQPLVENALYHGMGDDENRISIQGEMAGDRMIFRVTNSGYGLTDEKIHEIHRMIQSQDAQSSVGLKNVYQRLKLYYGDAADLRISSVIDESTTVTLVIPPPSAPESIPGGTS
ncbi:two-component system, sensor histidine kinase YesM [Alkalispirochaeta americana]|uniref:Two-component system, sensor histidine kinase YesM n=1 Tax=Alkalispirochaeta americana TaxID=159291 RepID=A0A1N6U4Y2_9SPIO|nr:sensor histidine kinase [Alkalispirochaeta americana]SIQ60692.1 two-component system, sensor histidine kinase YesM [Alkalispirochaeta americana]